MITSDDETDDEYNEIEADLDAQLALSMHNIANMQELLARVAVEKARFIRAREAMILNQFKRNRNCNDDEPKVYRRKTI